MRRTIYRCDRCGAESADPMEPRTVMAGTMCVAETGDLCKPCDGLLIRLLKQKVTDWLRELNEPPS